MNRRDIFKLFAGASVIPAVKSVETIDIQRDDVIVLKFDEHLSDVARKRVILTMTDALRGTRLEGTRVLVIDRGINIEVLKKS